MIVNRQELSQAMGVSLPTVDRWIRDGCPVNQRGAKGVAWEFSLPEIVAWWGNRQREAAAGESTADEAELKRRKLAAETATAELNLAKAKGLVAPLDQMERNLSKVFAEVRANMRNIPTSIVSVIIGETDERRLKKVLMEEIDKALEAMANADITAEDDDDECDEPGDL